MDGGVEVGVGGCVSGSLNGGSGGGVKGGRGAPRAIVQTLRRRDEDTAVDAGQVLDGLKIGG